MAEEDPQYMMNKAKKEVIMDTLKANGNVDDALALMRKLRQQGIRSHFWI